MRIALLMVVFSLCAAFASANPTLITAEQLSERPLLNETFREGAYVSLERTTYGFEEVAVRILMEPESIRIDGPNASFRSLGAPTNPLIFTPQEEGAYTIIARGQGTQQEVTFFVEEGFEPESPPEKPYQALVQGSENAVITVKDNQDRVLIRKNQRVIDDSAAFTALKNQKERVTARIEPENDLFEHLELENVDLGRFDLKIGKPNINRVQRQLQQVAQERIVNTYAVDPTGVNFTTGELVQRAKGTALYKCAEWDFDSQRCFGNWVKVQDLVPGELYSVEISPQDPAFAETGVATINTRKPTYTPGEVAELVAVVLDERGFLVPDAEVEIQVTSPGGVTTTFTDVSETSKGVYETTYLTTIPGTYVIQVAASGPGVEYAMLSDFLVADSYAFDIIRDTPVTFDPWQGPFLNRIMITPRDANVSTFSFTETIPADYEVVNSFGGTVVSNDDEIRITWSNITSGAVVQSVLQAPLESPDIDVFGPSTVSWENGSYEEARPWYIAVDPVSQWLTQNGTYQFSGGETQVDIAMNSSISDLSRAFVMVYSSGDNGANAPAENQITGYFLNTTHLRFNRDSGGDTPTVSWHVVENTGGDMFVQRGSISVTGASTTGTDTLATPVNLSRAFIVANTRASGGGSGDNFEGIATINFTANDTVSCVRAGTGSTMTCRYEVVEWRIPTATVQSGYLTMNSGSTTDIIPTAVNTSRAMLFHYINSDDNSLDTTAIAGRISSDSLLTFTRDSTGSGFLNEITWFVVEFPPGSQVQRNTIDSTADPSPFIENGSISAVDLTRSFAVHSNTCDGTGQAFPRTRWINYFTADNNVRFERFYNAQEFIIDYQVLQLPEANLIPNVTELSNPPNASTTELSLIDFNFTVTDDSAILAECQLYTNESGWGPVASITNVLNNTETNITYELADGTYLWTVACRDFYGSTGFATQNNTITVAAVADVRIDEIDGDLTEPFAFTDETPTLNITITNRDATCRISEFDESYADMVSNGRIDCGSFTQGVQKTCTYTNTLAINTQELFVACQTTAGLENNVSNNRDIAIDVLCDGHSDCPSNQHCNQIQNCAPDILGGFNCFDIGVGGGPQDEVCGDGSNSFCVNDSSFIFTGWYCTGDTDNCVYNNNGDVYDLGEELCIPGTNDYRTCSASNMWGSITDCAELFDPFDQSATAHPAEFCGFYSTAQSCVNASGCTGTPTDCGSYVYNQTTNSCGVLLDGCDGGCGAQCDAETNITANITGGVCFFDKECSNACSFTETTEVAPDFCINDNNGGPCTYNNRTNATQADSCYWNPVCTDGSGASLSSGAINNLRVDFCDYCTAGGNVSGGFAPEPNASCAAGCPNAGIIYYDTVGTPTNRSDDCGPLGSSTILSDTLSIGDIYNGSGPAFCEATECNLDCGTLVGTCGGGVCTCTDEDDPVVTLIEPFDVTWQNSTPVAFTYNVTDLSSGIANCSLLIDDAIVQTNSSINESLAVLTFANGFVNGSYNWTVQCVDDGALNNAFSPPNRFIGVDTVLPTVAAPNINASTLAISEQICINATASDALSGIGRVFVDVLSPFGNIEVDLFDDGLTCDDAADDGLFSFAYTIPADGDYNITGSNSVDLAGNVFSIAASGFWNVTEGGNLTAELLQPASPIEINESGQNTNFTLECVATCNEAFVDCDGVELSVQYFNGSWQPATNTTADLLTDVASFSCGDLAATEAPWWDNSFQYRRQVRIVAESAITTDNVMRVDYDMSGPKFQDDADDLRIVYYNGTDNIELDRDVFRPNESDTSIWFRVQNALGDNERDFNYYIYYGNDTVTNPPNNQSNIWLFYDDFSDGTFTDDWGLSSGSISVPSVSNPWSGVNTVLQVGSCDTSYVKILPASLPSIRDLHMRTLWMDNPGNTCGGGSPDADGVIGLRGSATTSYDGLLVERDTDTGFHFDIGATGVQNQGFDFSFFDEWQWSEVRAFGTSPGGHQAKYWNLTENEPFDYRLTASAVTATSSGQPFIRVASGTAYVAVVMVRPAVENEPFTQINPEEDENASILNSCGYNFTVTSGVDSGNNVWPVRCIATSTNTETGESNDENVTLNNNPLPSFDFPINDSYVAGTVSINVSSSQDLDGSIINYLFEYDDTAAFTSPATICSTADANCTWDTTAQNQCVNNSLSCFLRVTVTDDDNLPNSTLITIGFDTDGPTTILDVPQPFANISNNIAVNASASDTQTAVDAMTFEYRVNSTAPWQQICTNVSVPYQCLWNISSLADGEFYEVRAFANDTAGNVGGADTHTNITIDRLGPLVQLLQPPSNTLSNISITNFTFSVTDELLTIASCTLRLDDVNNQTLAAPAAGATLNFTKELANGLHYWNITCADTLSNNNITETRNITIDTLAPTATLTQPASFAAITATSDTEVVAIVFDTGLAGVDSVVFEYRQNTTGAWLAACTDSDGSSPFNCTWDVTGLPDGNEYQVRVRANDSAGNFGLFDDNTDITIDNNGPNVTLVFPSNQFTSAAPDVVFRYTVDDVAGSVDACSLFWDGSLNQTDTSITEGIEQTFSLTNLTDGNYTWAVNCTDEFGQTTTSVTYDIEIDIQFIMGINVSTDKLVYEVGDDIGERVNITSNITDALGGPLVDVDVTSDVVLVDDVTDPVAPWWNVSWQKRKPVFLSEDLGVNRTDVVVALTVDSLGGDISSCTNGLRVVHNALYLVPFEVDSGDNSNTCDVRFFANISANANNENQYFVYYDATAESSPGYGTLPTFTYTLLDEGFETGWTTITGEDPATECEGNQGGFTDCVNLSTSSDHAATSSGTAIAGSNILVMDDWGAFSAITGLSYEFNPQTACGGSACEDVRVSGYVATGSLDNAAEFCRVWARDTDTTTFSTVFNCNDGEACEFSNGGSDLPTSTGDYEFYNASFIDDLSLSLTTFAAVHIGGNVPGPGDQCYFDEIVVQGIASQGPNVTSTSIGGTQEFIQRNTSTTPGTGMWFYQLISDGFAAGNYSVVTLGQKVQYVDTFNNSFFELINDQTPPNITLNTPADGTEANSSVTFTYFVDDELSTVASCSLYINGVLDDTDIAIEEGPTQFFFPQIPGVGPNNWSVFCSDVFGNGAFTENRTIIIIPPELETNEGNITVSPGGPYVEGQAVVINATIWNTGGSDTATNFTVQLWDGDPDAGGVQIDDNRSINLTDQFGSQQNVTLSWPHILSASGPNTLFVVIDPPTATNGAVPEINDSNNKVSFNITVPAYVDIFGNITLQYTLDVENNDTFTNFSITTNNTGLIFFADEETVVSFDSLAALGRDVFNATSTADFSEADALLNMSGWPDSVNNVWANGTDTPQETRSYVISDRLIENVPVVNSSASGSFSTGILWDASTDTGNQEYDTTDQEGIIFAAELNASAIGDFGTYDYQALVPAYLRSYAGSGGSAVFLYFEIQ